MKRGLRQANLMLGLVHGKLNPNDSESEAQIQRTVFLSQNLVIRKTMRLKTIIRLIGYEVPLEDYRRGKCVDLMGYDKDYNLYIIELKKKDYTQPPSQIIQQINDYYTYVKKMLPSIEKEFNERYFFKIRFKSIKKILLAPREFYNNKIHLFTDKSIEYLKFLDKDITKIRPKEKITLHLIK